MALNYLFQKVYSPLDILHCLPQSRDTGAALFSEGYYIANIDGINLTTILIVHGPVIVNLLNNEWSGERVFSKLLVRIVGYQDLVVHLIGVRLTFLVVLTLVVLVDQLLLAFLDQSL